MGFKRGDRVEVANDNYADPGKSFTGTTGEVTGTQGDIVAIRPDGETRSLGFGAEELKRTR